MSSITIDDVKRLAQLSALHVTDEEAESLRRQLGDILGYVEQLDEVDTKGLEPTYQVTGLENVTREDEIKDYGVSQEDLLKNVPDHENGQIRVRKVL
jgi:aspartyl-tRNA(Asn)/glutamyl-tRNA(Gln) amidotransferase subunit C